jgi:holo-[acyl-carrier protein] synthase
MSEPSPRGQAAVESTPSVPNSASLLVGTDVQSIEEVRESLERYGARYYRRLFTDHELEQCGVDPTTSAGRLATRFAAKEAVLKILDLHSAVPGWREIEVRGGRGERPEVSLCGVAAQLAHDQGIRSISLSMSRGGGVATAIVVADLRGATN